MEIVVVPIESANSLVKRRQIKVAAKNVTSFEIISVDLWRGIIADCGTNFGFDFDFMKLLPSLNQS